ncbi:SUKH-3 immunity protein [Streptomyces sp. WMMB 322]|nr:SUKH-3 immunity protein [Streptomyces sp. WMMB 322]
MNRPPHQRTSTTRFPVAVDDALRNAGWKPGRWDIRQAEEWADALRGHISPGGHRHAIVPAAVEVWAEFGNLPIAPTGPGRNIAPASVHIDPMHALHAARTLADLGRALRTRICPLGTDGADAALLAIDTEARVYSLDHTGDWYLGQDFDTALAALLTGTRPERLTRPLDAATGTGTAADPGTGAATAARTRTGSPARPGPDPSSTVSGTVHTARPRGPR